VIVSLDLCEQLVEKEENHNGFKAFLEAFKEFEEANFGKEFKFQIDCEDKEGKMKAMVGKNMHELFDKGKIVVKHEENLQDAIC